MGKKKTIGITIIVTISILLFFVIAISFGKEMIEIEEEKLRNMSTVELMSLSVDWTYTDMLRNIDDYSEELIFVEGVVKNTQRDDEGSWSLTLYVRCDTEPEVICYNSERIFVNVNGITTWLEDDQLSGFVRVDKLSETGHHSDTTGEFIGSGDYIPSADEIRLTCSNC